MPGCLARPPNCVRCPACITRHIAYGRDKFERGFNIMIDVVGADHAGYLYDLASEFHALWTLGRAAPHLRFIIQDDRQMTAARLVLAKGVVTVLASGLALLGVQAPDEMQ